MAWTKAEIARRPRRHASRRSPKAQISEALNQKDKHTRIAGRRAREEGDRRSSCSPSSPTTRKDIAHARSATSSTTRSARRCSTPASASTAAARTKSARSRSTRGCCRARTARRCSRAARRRRSSPSRSARPTTCSASTRSTSRARRRSRSCCTTTSRRSPRAKFARCAAPVAPRDRPRQPRRARAAGRAAAVRGVPVHDSHRLRHPRVERLVVDGVGLRRLARAVRRRRSDSRAPSPAWRWA